MSSARPWKGNLKTTVAQLSTAGSAPPSEVINDTITHVVRPPNAESDTMRWQSSHSQHAGSIARQKMHPRLTHGTQGVGRGHCRMEVNREES